jgi:hypothetical protein
MIAQRLRQLARLLPVDGHRPVNLSQHRCHFKVNNPSADSTQNAIIYKMQPLPSLPSKRQARAKTQRRSGNKTWIPPISGNDKKLSRMPFQ